MFVRPLAGQFPCAINTLHVNDPMVREQCFIADRQSQDRTQHVMIRQGQCSCRQSGVALHGIEGRLLDGGQTRSWVFVEESKPAAQVLGKQVGASVNHEITIFYSCGWWHMSMFPYGLPRQTNESRKAELSSITGGAWTN
jgi:hypothetical protein